MDKPQRFTWNPIPCMMDFNYKKPRSACLFDYWSIHHGYWQGFFYILLHHFLKITSIKSAIILGVILTILHFIEEYLGNTNKISFEGIVVENIGPIFDPKINPDLREIDDDYLDNSIGDVFSGIIITCLIIGYWYIFGKLPYFYLFGFFIVFYMLLQKADMLYEKEDTSGVSSSNAKKHTGAPQTKILA